MKQPSEQYARSSVYCAITSSLTKRSQDAQDLIPRSCQTLIANRCKAKLIWKTRIRHFPPEAGPLAACPPHYVPVNHACSGLPQIPSSFILLFSFRKKDRGQLSCSQPCRPRLRIPFYRTDETTSLISVAQLMRMDQLAFFSG